MTRDDLLALAPDEATRATWATFLDTLDAINRATRVDGWVVLVAREAVRVIEPGWVAFFIRHRSRRGEVHFLRNNQMGIPIINGHEAGWLMRPVAAAFAFAAWIVQDGGPPP